MVRKTAKTTTEPITNPEDVEVGDTVDISGRDFLPKSNLEVVDVDPEWADDERYDDARVFTARIPNRSNARDYTFKVSAYGSVVTTNSRGVFDNYALEATKIVEGDALTVEGKDEVFGIDAIVSDHAHKCKEGYPERAAEAFDVVSKIVDEEARVGDVPADEMSVEFTVAETRIVYEAAEYAVEDRDFEDDAFAREVYRTLGGEAPVVCTDGGTDYADAKDDEVEVVRRALRDATDDDLDALFGEVVDYARTAEATPARVDVVVVPAMVARKGLRDGFGSWHFDRADGPIPGDGGERVVFHAHRDDDVRSLRNRVLQALTPFDPAHR